LNLLDPVLTLQIVSISELASLPYSFYLLLEKLAQERRRELEREKQKLDSMAHSTQRSTVSAFDLFDVNPKNKLDQIRLETPLSIDDLLK